MRIISHKLESTQRSLQKHRKCFPWYSKYSSPKLIHYNYMQMDSISIHFYFYFKTLNWCKSKQFIITTKSIIFSTVYNTSTIYEFTWFLLYMVFIWVSHDFFEKPVKILALTQYFSLLYILNFLYLLLSTCKAFISPLFTLFDRSLEKNFYFLIFILFKISSLNYYFKLKDAKCKYVRT